MGTVTFMTSMVCVVVGTLCTGCVKPTRDDLIGTWANPDGASLTLKSDDTFLAKALPTRVFLHDSVSGPLTGTGQWKFKEHNSVWSGDNGVIQIHFDEIGGQSMSRTGISVIVSGAGKSVTLFQWEGEEGGARYELRKQ